VKENPERPVRYEWRGMLALIPATGTCARVRGWPAR
jgi:hypothetical protein